MEFSEKGNVYSQKALIKVQKVRNKVNRISCGKYSVLSGFCTFFTCEKYKKYKKYKKYEKYEKYEKVNDTFFFF